MTHTLTSQNHVNTKTDILNDRQNIFELQKFLQKIGERDDAIPFINTDGIYGKETADAVRLFQKARGLDQTGIVDYETWEEIMREYERILKAEGPALPFEVFPIEVLEIKSGDSGDVVVVIQLILNSLSGRYSNISPVTTNGIYGEDTANSVRDFQTSLAMSPTGVVDRNTWNELNRLYGALLINE